MSEVGLGALVDLGPIAAPSTFKPGPTFASRLRARLVVVALGDAIAGGVACWLIQSLWTGYLSRPPLNPLVGPVFFGAAWVFVFLLLDGYSVRVPVNRIHSFVVILKALLPVSLFGVLVFFIQPYGLARPEISLSILLGAALILIVRIVMSLAMRQPLPLRVLLIGPPATESEVFAAVQDAHLECRMVGSVTIPRDGAIIRLGDEVGRQLSQEAIDYVVIAGRAMDSVPELVEACAGRGTRVVTVGALIERFQSRVLLSEVTSHWFIDISDAHAWDRPYLAVRRGADIALSLTLGVLLLPVVLMAALLIKIDSPGPVLLRQQRLGHYGREFKMLKLRSMRADAEPNGPTWAQLRDPRVTRIGRLLRATHMDEVPQLINIIRGDMSLIGPRPERPEFYDLLESSLPHFRSRLLAKPGLSGWAQVNSGYAASVAEATRKLEHDLYYVKNRSFRLDLQIVLLTIFSVLGLRGR